MERMKHQETGLFGRIAASIAAVGLFTFLFLRVLPANTTTVALVFMLLVLIASAVWTLWEALATALAASLALDYFFLPPWGFRIADPNDIVALGSFIICALIGSQLALTARRRAAEASRRQDEMERLYALSRAFMLIPRDVSAPKLVAFQLVQLFGFPGVALFLCADGLVYRSGPEDVSLSDEQLRDAARVGGPDRNFPAFKGTVVSLGHDGVLVGTLAVLDKGMSPTTMHAIANLAAIALFRAQQQEP